MPSTLASTTFAICAAALVACSDSAEPIATGGAGATGTAASAVGPATTGSGGTGGTGSGSGGASAGFGGATGTGTGGAGGNPGCSGAPPAGPPATGTPGVWQDVTPAGVDLLTDFGAQDVLVDPARPSDLYAFVCKQGVWKSTDYGATFVHVSTGTNAVEFERGRPWSAGIDTNRCRDPNTPPTLYTFSGYGSKQGFWKSVDGGVSWTQTNFPDQASLQYDQDAYSIAVDPYDGKHLLVGYHEAVGLVESTDAGATWTARMPADDGVSVYPNFVDTGDPVTTRTTWLTIGQSGKLSRTTNGGETWTTVDPLQHAHGCSQIFQAGGGVIYIPGNSGSQGNGIYRSTDYGATVTKVADGSENSVVGTATRLYASYAWANAGGVDPSLKTAPRAGGTAWTATPAPAGMSNGSKAAAVTYDGQHYVIVSGNWNAGIWRYVEP